MSLCILFTVGCTKHSTKTEISFGDWIHTLNEKAGIHDFTETRPYFLNVPVTSTYYEDIQAAVEWGILDTSHTCNVDEPVTREVVAYTLIHLADVELSNETGKYKDIQKTNYPKEVTTAVNLGLFDLDNHNRFMPQETMDEKDALALLDVIVEYINSYTFDQTENEITYKDNVELNTEVPINYDLSSNTITYKKDSNIEKGQYTYIDSILYKIVCVEETESSKVAKIELEDGTSIIDSFHASGSDTLDFSEAQIIEDYGNEETSYVEPTNFKLMSISSLQKTFTYKDYKVKWRLTSSGIYTEIYKENAYGGKAYADFTLSSVKPSYLWDMSNGKINHAYFRVDFKTSEELGFKQENNKTLYGNFSNLKGNNFIENCKNFFQEKRSVTEIEIPIAKVQVPLPSNPSFSVKIELRLKLYASGKAEIIFSQEDAVGMEIKNGHLRTIHKCDSDSEALIKATTGSSAKLLFSLNTLNLTLANTAVESGIEAVLKSTVHSYDENLNLTSSSSDVPLDILEEASSNNSSILVCGDLTNKWYVTATVNNSSSIAGKLGFTKKFNILSGPFLPFNTSHFENGQFVKSCTRKSKSTTTSKSDPIESSQIRIQTYAITLSEGSTKTLMIKALPKGYELNDIEYTSSNTNVAIVNEDGVITGIKEGSARISLETRDGKYSVYCSVLVQKK